MKAVQKGFTLIELMIVVAIIGILAAIAIPAYQDYTIRSQVTEGLNLSASLKTGVSEYFAQYGAWPTLVVGNVAGSLGLVGDPSGKYVSDITISGAGTLLITYANTGGFQANAKINGFKLALQPRLSGTVAAGNEDVVWVCGLNAGPTAVHDPATAAPPAAGLTTVPARFLPANCRT